MGAVVWSTEISQGLSVVKWLWILKQMHDRVGLTRMRKGSRLKDAKAVSATALHKVKEAKILSWIGVCQRSIRPSS